MLPASEERKTRREKRLDENYISQTFCIIFPFKRSEKPWKLASSLKMEKDILVFIPPLPVTVKVDIQNIAFSAE